MNIRQMIKLAKETIVTEKDIERINSKLKEIDEETSKRESQSQSEEFLNKKYTI